MSRISPNFFCLQKYNHSTEPRTTQLVVGILRKVTLHVSENSSIRKKSYKCHTIYVISGRKWRIRENIGVRYYSTNKESQRKDSALLKSYSKDSKQLLRLAVTQCQVLKWKTDQVEKEKWEQTTKLSLAAQSIIHWIQNIWNKLACSIPCKEMEVIMKVVCFLFYL